MDLQPISIPEQKTIAGATASGTTVGSGAYQLDYGSASATTLGSGAIQYVFSNALASARQSHHGAPKPAGSVQTLSAPAWSVQP